MCSLNRRCMRTETSRRCLPTPALLRPRDEGGEGEEEEEEEESLKGEERGGGEGVEKKFTGLLLVN